MCSRTWQNYYNSQAPGIHSCSGTHRLWMLCEIWTTACRWFSYFQHCHRRTVSRSGPELCTTWSSWYSLLAFTSVVLQSRLEYLYPAVEHGLFCHYIPLLSAVYPVYHSSIEKRDRYPSSIEKRDRYPTSIEKRDRYPTSIERQDCCKPPCCAFNMTWMSSFRIHVFFVQCSVHISTSPHCVNYGCVVPFSLYVWLFREK